MPVGRKLRRYWCKWCDTALRLDKKKFDDHVKECKVKNP